MCKRNIEASFNKTVASILQFISRFKDSLLIVFSVRISASKKEIRRSLFRNRGNDFRCRARSQSAKKCSNNLSLYKMHRHIISNDKRRNRDVFRFEICAVWTYIYYGTFLFMNLLKIRTNSFKCIKHYINVQLYNKLQ